MRKTFHLAASDPRRYDITTMEVESAGHRLFDRSQEYDAELNQGLGLYGEDKQFFLAGRVSDLQKQLGEARPGSILDFGCGFGDSSRHLAAMYPEAQVLLFDFGYSSYVLSKACGGDHYAIASGTHALAFCPLAGVDDPHERVWAQEWLRTARKNNAAVVFVSQSLADICHSPKRDMLLSSCPTKGTAHIDAEMYVKPSRETKCLQKRTFVKASDSLEKSVD